ncbi:MAG: PadR family transcriptional regulator [Conexivisphaerales archaeon]
MGFVYFGRPWRMVRRGGLRPLVLRILSTSPRNGAEIMDEIEKFTWGWWRPSPGSVYPLLEEMAGEGLVKKREDGRYEITDKGRQELEWPFPKMHHLQAGAASIDEMLSEISGELQYFEDLKTTDAKKLEPYMEKLKQIADRFNKLVQ